MDRKLIVGAFLLFLVQAFMLVADIDIYPNGEYENAMSRRHQKLGTIVYKKDNVKRRQQGAIVWEDTSTPTELVSHDSVLTLDNSSAQIHLEKNIEIDLQENTLITIEPPSNLQQDSLRIRFTRGYFHSKTQSALLHIQNEVWDIETKPGTHLGIKNLSDSKTQIEVLKGEVLYKSSTNPSKSQTLGSGVKVVVKNDEVIERLQISKELNWTHQPEERIYSHEFPTPFLLKWTGQASAIRMLQPDKSEVDLPIQAGQNNLPIKLSPGTYSLSLISGTQSSPELIVQALPAPKIIYITPLPRDRYSADAAIPFRWTPVEAAKIYEIDIRSENAESERLSAPLSFLSTPIHLQGLLWMRVTALDELGFRIPPLYSLPFYRLADPLAAPKLKAPEIRQPANESPDIKENIKSKDSSSLNKFWRRALAWIWGESAYAQGLHTQKNVVFSWQKVEGADFYNIEISSTPDFAKPEVMTTVATDKFVWSQYQKKIYYWRVAAGTNAGRLGLFSESAIIDLSQIDNIYSGEIYSGVSVETISKAPRTAPAKMPRSDTPEQVRPESSPPPLDPITEIEKPSEPQDPPKGNWNVDAQFNLHHKDYSTKQEFTSSLSGFADYSFATAFYFVNPDEQIYLAQFRFTQLSWKPQELPFQSEMQTKEIQYHFISRPTNSAFGYGLAGEKFDLPVRADLEELKLKNYHLLGPALEYSILAAAKLQFTAHSSILFANGLTALNFNNAIEYQLSKSRAYYVGGDLDFKMFFGSDKLSGFDMTAGLHLGKSW